MDGQDQNQSPLNPDLAGYPNTEALVRGYRESSQEAQRQKTRADLAEQMAQSILSRLGDAANPRQTVPDRNSSPESKLLDMGIPVDELRQVIRNEVGQAFEPISRGISARQTVLGRHKDYQSFEADVAAWVQSDPDRNQSYQRAFAADPVVAMEWAFQGFAQDRRNSLSPQDQTREEITHAAIPGARNGETRRQPMNGEDRVERAWDAYQRNPNSQTARAYAQERLHRVITDAHLNA